MSCCGDSTNTRHGIVRQCTDVLWLCIFIAFICLLILIAAFAIVFGNPLLLINGYDSFGNICGTQNEMSGALNLSGWDVTDRPFLFDLDVTKDQLSLKICVKKCPDKDINTFDELKLFFDKTGSMLCRYDFHFDNIFKYNGTIDEDIVHSELGPCPVLPVYKSDVVLNRCVPSSDSPVNVNVLTSLYAALNSPAMLEQLMSDLYSTWTYILLITLLAFALSLAMVLLLRVATLLMAWIFMITVSISAIAGSGMLWWIYCETKWLLDETPPAQMLEETAHNERWFLALAILATIITLVLLILVVHVGRHIAPLVQLFQEASNSLKVLPELFIQPAITVSILLCLFCAWTYIVLCLATAMLPDAQMYRFEPKKLELQQDINSSAIFNMSLNNVKTFTLLGFSETSWVRYCWWVYVLALLWVSELVLSCQQMATAGAVVNWYFHKERHGKGRFLRKSIRRMLSYHVGSVVLGSLLIMICKVPRLIMRFTSHRLQSDGSCTRCGRSMCRCCLCCYDRGLRVVNHNAYAVIAIEGLDFCQAAHIAYQTMESNSLQFAVINSIGDCLLFLGKSCVTAICGCIGLLLMRQDPQLHFYAVPMLVLCIFCFFVAHSVFTLYEMVLDSLFLCVAEDKALSIGDHAYYRPILVAALTKISVVRKHNSPGELATVIERQPMRL